MAGDMRTLTMQILAQTDQFSKGLKDAQTETESFSSKVGGFVANATKAFVAMGAAVGSAALAIGVSAVKAAIDDQKETALLEQAVRNYTGASKEQVDAVNEYIDATERAAGVNSTQIIPSFERLLRTFKDVTKAQEIQKVAQDVAAGTGKSLTEVSDALARAYEGNTKGLKDLGIQLTTSQTVTKKVKVSKDDLAKSELNAQSATLGLQSAQERLNKVLSKSDSTALDVAKAQNALEKAQLRASDSTESFDKKQKNLGKTISETKDVAIPFDQLLGEISKKFEGSAAAAADTYAGKLEILRTAIGKAQEGLGEVLFPVLEKIVNFININIVPAIEDFVAGLSGNAPSSLTGAIKDAKGRVQDFAYDGIDRPGTTGGYSLGAAFRRFGETLGLIGSELTAQTGEGGDFKKFLDFLTKLVDALDSLASKYNTTKNFIGGAIDIVGLQGPLESVGKFGEKYNPFYLGGTAGQPMGQIVINNNFNPVTPKAAANQVVKQVNSAVKQGTTNKLAANSVLR